MNSGKNYLVLVLVALFLAFPAYAQNTVEGSTTDTTNTAVRAIEEVSGKIDLTFYAGENDPVKNTDKEVLIVLTALPSNQDEPTGLDTFTVSENPENVAVKCNREAETESTHRWNCTYTWDTTRVDDGIYYVEVKEVRPLEADFSSNPEIGPFNVNNKEDTAVDTPEPPVKDPVVIEGPEPTTQDPVPVLIPSQTDTQFNGKVHMIEYSDFQCPFCKRFHDDTLSLLRQRYGDQLVFEYKHFPLSSIHPNAHLAAQASECAKDQDRFWEYHDTLFNEQSIWANSGTPSEHFKTFAEKLVLDTSKFVSCLESGSKKAVVDADFAEGQKLGINGTPGFIINGETFVGAAPFSSFVEFIENGTVSDTLPREPGPIDNIEPPRKQPVPDKRPVPEVKEDIAAEKMVTLLIKLENLSIRFDALAAASDKLAAYYLDRDLEKRGIWKTVGLEFNYMIANIDGAKDLIREKAEANNNQFTQDMVDLVKETTKEIKESLRKIALTIVS